MIIDLLLSAHARLYSLNDIHHYKSSNKAMWMVTNLGDRAVEWLLNKWIVVRSKLGVYSKPLANIREDVVISFTTFPPRIGKVWMTVDSLIRQTTRPYKIMLYLSEEDFPEKEKSLPKELTRYTDFGLNIVWVKENLRPHKKYLYAFELFKDKCVVTVDDDLYYRKDMLERLLKLHETHPDAVCANNAKLIPTTNTDEIPLYKTWQKLTNPAIGGDVIGIGSGGILYPVHLFNSVSYKNVELIKNLSLGTDDLWLKVMEVIAGIPVATGDYNCAYPKISGSQKSSLSKENWKIEDKNDINWRKLVAHFNLKI